MTVRPDIAASATAATVENADITVVGGAGHVGIPLVLAFAEAGLRVNVNDLNQAALDTLQSGKLPFIEVRRRRPCSPRRSPVSGWCSPPRPTTSRPADRSSSPSARRSTSFSIRCASVVQDCIDALLPPLARRATCWCCARRVFPGTTDWLDAYLKRERTQAEGGVLPRARRAGLWAQRTARDAADRQRLHAAKPSAKPPRCSSGSRRKSWCVSADRGGIRQAVQQCLSLHRIRRDQSSSIWSPSRPGVDYQRVLRAMKHNYPRAEEHAAARALPPARAWSRTRCSSRPSPATSSASATRRCLINEGLVLHVIEDLKRRYDLANITVGLLGMAFKAESDDTRASLSYKFKKVLSGQTRAVLTTDPFVTTDPELMPLDDGDRAERSADLVRAACRLSRRRLQGQAGVRRLGPSSKAPTSSDDHGSAAPRHRHPGIQ